MFPNPSKISYLQDTLVLDAHKKMDEPVSHLLTFSSIIWFNHLYQKYLLLPLDSILILNSIGPHIHPQTLKTSQKCYSYHNLSHIATSYDSFVQSRPNLSHLDILFSPAIISQSILYQLIHISNKTDPLRSSLEVMARHSVKIPQIYILLT